MARPLPPPDGSHDVCSCAPLHPHTDGSETALVILGLHRSQHCHDFTRLVQGWLHEALVDQALFCDVWFAHFRSIITSHDIAGELTKTVATAELGLLTIRISLQRQLFGAANETVSLYHAVHVNNTP